MLTEICQRLKNWFDLKSDHTPYGHYNGTITITTNTSTHKSTISINGNVMEIPTNHFRLIDSLKNNGVHSVDDELIAETFDGALWLMVIPAEVIALAADMSQWVTDYGNASKAPFSSESHKGYSYTKAVSNSGSGANMSVWAAFESELSAWRKII